MSEKIISKNTVITITSGTFFRAFLALILIAVLYYLRDLAAVILFSVVIASGIEPAVMFLGRRRIPRVFGVILVFLSYNRLKDFRLTTSKIKSNEVSSEKIREIGNKSWTFLNLSLLLFSADIIVFVIAIMWT